VKIVVKSDSTKILFTHTELLADPENPSHAYCSGCDSVQPIKNFRRKPTPLMLEKWGWDKLLDKRNATHIFKTCNKCAKKERLFPRCFDYDRYDRTLKTTGQHEYIVITKDGERMTQRELMVKQKREKRREGKVKGGVKAQRTRYRQQYIDLHKQIRTELAKVKYQRTKMQGLTPNAKAYLIAYVAHLQSITDTILINKQEARKAKQTPNDYINPDSLPTRTAHQYYATLTSLERERVSSKYLEVRQMSHQQTKEK
jgi:hypothetical protein